MINNVFSMGVGVMYDFSGANEQQKEAIQTTEGPVLITAGPGECVIIVTRRNRPDKQRLRAA